MSLVNTAVNTQEEIGDVIENLSNMSIGSNQLKTKYTDHKLSKELRGGVKAALYAEHLVVCYANE